MGKVLLLFVLLLLGVAFFTRPDDKACILGAVQAVWGSVMPDPYEKPDFFEHFMNLNSSSVRVKDWFFFKQVLYKLSKEERTVALGAFKKVYHLVEPLELQTKIPEMPGRR